MLGAVQLALHEPMPDRWIVYGRREFLAGSFVSIRLPAKRWTQNWASGDWYLRNSRLEIRFRVV